MVQGTREFHCLPDEPAMLSEAHVLMHHEDRTVQMVYDPSGVYRTWAGVYFSWWEFVYTSLLHHWPEGAIFRLSPVNGEEVRTLTIARGQVMDVWTGEKLVQNWGNQRWEYALAAERLWKAVRLEGGLYAL